MSWDHEFYFADDSRIFLLGLSFCLLKDTNVIKAPCKPLVWVVRVKVTHFAMLCIFFSTFHNRNYPKSDASPEMKWEISVTRDEK